MFHQKEIVIFSDVRFFSINFNTNYSPFTQAAQFNLLTPSEREISSEWCTIRRVKVAKQQMKKKCLRKTRSNIWFAHIYNLETHSGCNGEMFENRFLFYTEIFKGLNWFLWSTKLPRSYIIQKKKKKLIIELS